MAQEQCHHQSGNEAHSGLQRHEATRLGLDLGREVVVLLSVVVCFTAVLVVVLLTGNEISSKPNISISALLIITASLDLCRTELILQSMKIYLTFPSFLTPKSAGSMWFFFLWKTRISFSCTVNIMFVDALAMQEAPVSTAMILWYWPSYFPEYSGVSPTKGGAWMIPS